MVTKLSVARASSPLSPTPKWGRQASGGRRARHGLTAIPEGLSRLTDPVRNYRPGVGDRQGHHEEVERATLGQGACRGMGVDRQAMKTRDLRPVAGQGPVAAPGSVGGEGSWVF